jgi:transcriptional regulator with XRE-family HTH domain
MLKGGGKMQLRAIRESQGICLTKLAKSSGIKPSYLSEIERGIKKNPSKDVMERIAKSLGKTMDEVFREE